MKTHCRKRQRIFRCTNIIICLTAELEEDQDEGHSSAPTAKRPCQCCCQTYSEILSFLEKRSEAEQRLREEEFALRREEFEIQRSTILCVSGDWPKGSGWILREARGVLIRFRCGVPPQVRLRWRESAWRRSRGRGSDASSWRAKRGRSSWICSRRRC